MIFKLDNSTILRIKNSEKSRYGLREDVRRVIAYEMDPRIKVINKVGFLHPSEAVILALFNGKRTLGEIVREVGYLFDQSLEEAEKTVKIFCYTRGEILEEKNNGFCINYNPKNFIIPAERIDLVSPKLYKPLGVIFHVSDDCMRDCIYCSIQKRRTKDLKLLSLERWNSLAEEIKTIGVVSVVMSGGDPFMRQNFLEILSYFTSRGIEPDIATKSFISERKAAELASLGIKRIQISIDAPYAEVADYLTNSKGYFDQAIASIKNLLKNGIKVRTNTVITSYNALLIPTLCNMLADLGVDIIRFSTYGRSLFIKHRDEFFVNEEVGNWLENEIKKISDLRKEEVDIAFSYPRDSVFLSLEEREEKFKKRAICSAGRWSLIILSDGKVIPCDENPVDGEFIVGDVSNHKIMEVWESPLMDKFVNPSQELFKGTACYKCNEFKECMKKGWCFRDSYKAFGAIYTSPPGCPKAPKGLRLA